jgi:hypothetical protein
MKILNKLQRLIKNSSINIDLRSQHIPLSKILLGGENDLSGYKYSLMTGDYLRPSKKVEESPHSQLLKDYIKYGIKILDKDFFEKTFYFKNAQTCIDLFGGYFPHIDTDDKICLAAERFIKLFTKENVSHLPSDGHSPDGELITVIPIQNSDCFQLLQGNHRVAFAVANSHSTIKANILYKRQEITPIQFLLENLQWEQGDKILYQPLPCPELESQWSLARNCEDRLLMMKNFISETISLKPDNSLYLDLGSYYGWFVNKFSEIGFESYGVEKDNIPIQIGQILFKNLQQKIFKDEIVRFLRGCNKTYDIVSCLSIMHHFINQREKREPKELLKLLDKCTGKVLFFEMGEEHEQWFSTSLQGWNTNFIEEWVLRNTSFTKSYQLGRDKDSQGMFVGNFGRMLFAFVK